ncbi:transcriptional regulator [Halosimplex rubrum]|uniref:Transcriptional regulator n=1 Tax=Halosimplex rubrum TaxID=869889 RepID=A0A7D5TL41_9EURY|nr:MarR family transcriptional regulator [Halosimplex rubrum]QLH77172.1 transcriptional regulator [Halosimplex rubrum]
MPPLQRRQLAAAVAFVAAAVVLAVQLITPSPVVVSVGENGTTVSELGTYFTPEDIAVVAAAGALLGASGTYLLVGDSSTPDAVSSTASAATESLPESGAATVDSTAPERSSGPEPSDELVETRREELEETARRLSTNERAVYETVLDADGVLPQTEIVAGTDFSKATVSRTLDTLESKDLLERRRRGMGNVVYLR